MNKKIVIVVCGLIFISILIGIFTYVILFPKEGATPLHIDQNLIESSESTSSYDDDLSETNSMDSGIEETSVDLLNNDLTVNLDLLTDEQRQKILSKELTMDELKGEMSHEKTSETLDTLPLFGEIESQDNNKSNDENIINFGEPDIQLGTELEQVILSTEKSQQDVLTLENIIEETSATSKDNKVLQKTEIKLEKTFDKSNTRNLPIIALLAVAIIMKIIIRRRQHE